MSKFLVNYFTENLIIYQEINYAPTKIYKGIFVWEKDIKNISNEESMEMEYKEAIEICKKISSLDGGRIIFEGYDGYGHCNRIDTHNQDFISLFKNMCKKEIDIHESLKKNEVTL